MDRARFQPCDLAETLRDAARNEDVLILTDSQAALRIVQHLLEHGTMQTSPTARAGSRWRGSAGFRARPAVWFPQQPEREPSAPELELEVAGHQ